MGEVTPPRHSALKDYDRWLDRAEQEQLPLALLRPFEPDAVQLWLAVPDVVDLGIRLVDHSRWL